MLVYFTRARRQYHKFKVKALPRKAWEFQIVLRGEIALVTSSGPGLLKSRHLWLIRPDFAHSWTGVPRGSAQVAVFHFNYLPVDLQRRLPEDAPFFEMPLSAGQCRKIEALAKDTLKYWKTLSPGRSICFESTLMNLSLMVFEALQESENEKLPASTAQRIQSAIRYYSANIGSNPSLPEIARKAGVSSAQLRRDFIHALHMSPKKVFNDIRLKRALEYLQEGEHTVEEAAEQCGFLSTSTFSRAFKTKFGQSPRKFVNAYEH
jgi:AraC-like DNA-binding protein